MIERADFEQWKSKEVARLLALVETERRYYQEMVAMLPVPLAVLSAVQTAVYANRAFRQKFELRGEELRRLTIAQIFPGAGVDEKIREAHASGVVPEPLVIQAGGRTLRISIVPFRNWDDETELETLLLAEELPAKDPSAPEDAGVSGDAPPAESPSALALEPAREPAAGYFDEIPAALWQADASTLRFTQVSPGAERLLGYPAQQWLDEPNFFAERILPDDRAAVLEVYRAAVSAPIASSSEPSGDSTSEPPPRTSSVASAEFRVLTASGNLLWCRETIRIIPGSEPASEPGSHGRSGDGAGIIAGVLTDITRRKEVERRVLAAGRIEALQAVSGRLAHDLNNPLMIATGYSEELVSALPEGSPHRKDAEEIVKATTRLAAIAAQLNSYSRRSGIAPESVDLGEVFAEIQPALSSATGLALELTPDREPLIAAAGRETLIGLLFALASSAREGAEDRTRLAITWAPEFIGDYTPGSTLAPGKYACITLRDDGRGLAPGRAHALFESVLLEKEPSSVATALARGYALVREWGGDIGVSSMVGQGTTISIYLPLLQPPSPESLPAVEPAPAAPPPPEPLREVILVVDDEAGIRGLVRKILKREHYNVLEAASAEEALTISVSRAAPLDLLLTDVKLPGLSGPELARRMYEASPNLKVLYISGYTDDPSVLAGDYPPGSRFLAKPFTLSALLKAVREVLDA